MTNLPEVEGTLIIRESIKKYVLELDGEGLAVLYGLIDAVKDEPNENGATVQRLKSLLYETHGQWHPGHYVFVDGIPGDGLDLHND